MDGQITNYYSERLQIPADAAERLAAPSVVISDENFSIRSAAPEVQAIVDAKLKNYSSPFTLRLAELLTAPENVRDDCPVEGAEAFQFSYLRQHLIDKKIVTGSVEYLAIAATVPDDLPKIMADSFARNNAKERKTETTIEGYDIFYRVWGRLKLGRRLAQVACGVCVTPYIDTHLQKPETAEADSEKGMLGFRYLVQRDTNKSATSGAEAWDASIEEAKALKAQRMRNPYMGGSISSR